MSNKGTVKKTSEQPLSEMAYSHYNDPYEQGIATQKHIFDPLHEYIKVINAIIKGKQKQWKDKDYKKGRLKFACRFLSKQYVL